MCFSSSMVFDQRFHNHLNRRQSHPYFLNIALGYLASAVSLDLKQIAENFEKVLGAAFELADYTYSHLKRVLLVDISRF